MKNRKNKPMLRSLQLAGVAAAGATAAFVPGQAEAHCGHGMYGQIYHDYWGEEWNYGCTGKGDTPEPSFYCVTWDPWQGCMEWYAYYNCYEPC
jgi:hypothetical protein